MALAAEGEVGDAAVEAVRPQLHQLRQAHVRLAFGNLTAKRKRDGAGGFWILLKPERVEYLTRKWLCVCVCVFVFCIFCEDTLAKKRFRGKPKGKLEVLLRSYLDRL